MSVPLDVDVPTWAVVARSYSSLNCFESGDRSPSTLRLVVKLTRCPAGRPDRRSRSRPGELLEVRAVQVHRVDLELPSPGSCAEKTTDFASNERSYDWTSEPLTQLSTSLGRSARRSPGWEDHRELAVRRGRGELRQAAAGVTPCTRRRCRVGARVRCRTRSSERRRAARRRSRWLALELHPAPAPSASARRPPQPRSDLSFCFP